MATTNYADMIKPRNIAIAVGIVIVLAIVAWAGGLFGTKAPREATAPATTTEQPAITGQESTTPPATTGGAATTEPSTTTQQ